MVKRFVYGVYDSTSEARTIYDALIQKGIPTSAINLVADEEVVDAFNNEAQNVEDEPTDMAVEAAPTVGTANTTTQANNLGGTSFGNFFVFDAAESGLSNEVDLSNYKKDIKDGKVLVVVDEAFEAETISLDTSKLNVGRDRSETPLVDDLKAEAREKHHTSEVREKAVMPREQAVDPQSKNRRFVDLSNKVASEDTMNSLSNSKEYGHAAKSYDKRKNSTAHTVSTRGVDLTSKANDTEVRYDQPDSE